MFKGGGESYVNLKRVISRSIYTYCSEKSHGTSIYKFYQHPRLLGANKALVLADERYKRMANRTTRDPRKHSAMQRLEPCTPPAIAERLSRQEKKGNKHGHPAKATQGSVQQGGRMSTRVQGWYGCSTSNDTFRASAPHRRSELAGSKPNRHLGNSGPTRRAMLGVSC